MIENDAVFTALANRQRRRLLIDLFQDGIRPLPPLSDEARELLAADEALLREFLTTSERTAPVDAVLLRLYHVHLPVLAEHGFVEWDRDARLVTEGPKFEEVKPLLRLIVDRRDDPPETEPAGPLRLSVDPP